MEILLSQFQCNVVFDVCSFVRFLVIFFSFLVLLDEYGYAEREKNCATEGRKGKLKNNFYFSIELIRNYSQHKRTTIEHDECAELK